MLKKMLLRLMGVEQKPFDPFEGDAEGVRYYVEARPNGNASIWMYLPRDQMNIEPQLRKGSDDHVPRTALDQFIQAVWNFGGSSIDIGLSGDKIEVMASTDINQVDRNFVQPIAALMIQIRNEVLGEVLPYKMPRSFEKAAEAQVNINGQAVNFEFSSCVVHTEEDFAGNLDLMVRTDPICHEDQIAEGVRLALPGYEDLISPDGYGRFDDGEGILGMSFGLVHSNIGFDEEVRKRIREMEFVQLFWGDGREHLLAEIPCQYPRSQS